MKTSLDIAHTSPSPPKKRSVSNVLMKNRFSKPKPNVHDYMVTGGKHDITDEQTAWYTRMLFNGDEEPNLKRMSAEAKRACQFIGLSPQTLIKLELEDIKNSAESGMNQQVLEMRCHHQESRRRKRLRFLFEYVKANK